MKSHIFDTYLCFYKISWIIITPTIRKYIKEIPYDYAKEQIRVNIKSLLVVRASAGAGTISYLTYNSTTTVSSLKCFTYQIQYKP